MSFSTMSSAAAPILSHSSSAAVATAIAKQFSPLSPFIKFTTSSSPKQFTRPITKLKVTSKSTAATSKPTTAGETIYFDGGAHYGDLLANLLLGFTLLWLPLTLAAVLRSFYLRYRFTNLRVTVISGLTGQERSDFSYKVIKDVQVVPRFIGEWGDVIITLKDGTKVDLRSVPKFREIAKYSLSMAAANNNDQSPVPVLFNDEIKPKGF
ncbi:uncharacterized protein LOC124935709 [Impatiens glandulifera]|uniref:uncharacterized protein LOC124935709 n=1 Tax=Impatiens glandulifera TaxID=253017 RepID=UPI001FB0899C|nr:uncharacterized protein LOC124935709 [Impatiens glandulifera]